VIDEATALARVRAHFPELAAKRAVLLGGHAIRSFLVDDAFVFRFTADATRLEIELRLLDALAPHVPFAVPAHGFRAAGIYGHPVLAGPIARVARYAPAQLGAALGRALAALAAFPIRDALALGMRWRSEPSHNLAALFRDLVSRYERARRTLDPVLSARGDALVLRARVPAPYLDAAALVHGGISQFTVHVGDRLGLAAWDEVNFGDPAVDLGCIGFAFGRTALDAAIGAMNRPDLAERAAFVVRCTALSIVVDPSTPDAAKSWALERSLWLAT